MQRMHIIRRPPLDTPFAWILSDGESNLKKGVDFPCHPGASIITYFKFAVRMTFTGVRWHAIPPVLRHLGNDNDNDNDD